MLGLQATGWPSIALFGLPGFLFLSKQGLEGGGEGIRTCPLPFHQFLLSHMILPISHFPVTSGAV